MHINLSQVQVQTVLPSEQTSQKGRGYGAEVGVVLQLFCQSFWKPPLKNFRSAIDIVAKTWTSALMKVCPWTTIDGNAYWTSNGRQRHQQGTKTVSGKITNWFSYSSYSCQIGSFHNSSVMVVDTAF